jgi:hypothetical protein
MGKNLIVLFPGGGYSVDRPLLYYAGFKYYGKGYESIKINYGDCVKLDKSFNDIIEDIKKVVSEQVKETDFSVYDDVLFVSKSLGTVAAGWLAGTLSGGNIRHIYLTPIKETLQFIKNGENISIVIAGTKDKFLKADILKEHCEREKINLELIEDTGHSLEKVGYMNVNENIDILKRVAELY